MKKIVTHCCHLIRKNMNPRTLLLVKKLIRISASTPVKLCFKVKIK
jgi:hypothetical protein